MSSRKRTFVSIVWMMTVIAAGMVMLPSAFWWFSSTATRARPTARPEPLSVCTKRGLPPPSGLNRTPALRAWKSSKLETF